MLCCNNARDSRLSSGITREENSMKDSELRIKVAELEENLVNTMLTVDMLTREGEEDSRTIASMKEDIENLNTRLGAMAQVVSKIKKGE
jgi:hypothetical protein